MRYVGGKSKLANGIADVIRLTSGPRRELYIEPFIGGGASFAANAPMFDTAYAGDSVPDLVMMWRQVLAGWQPPETITEAQYAELRTAEPSALRGFAGFGGSFGGKWFGGYARGGLNADGTPRNHQAESARNVTRIGELLSASDVRFTCCDYTAWSRFMRPGVTVYCDPPYAGVTGYRDAGTFDTAEFWRTVGDWSDRGALVLVSEYAAPPEWVSIWIAERRQTLQHGSTDRPLTVENLYGRQGDSAIFDYLYDAAA